MIVFALPLILCFLNIAYGAYYPQYYNYGKNLNYYKSSYGYGQHSNYCALYPQVNLCF